MTVFRLFFIRMMKNKFQMLLMILLPALFLIFIASFMTSGIRDQLKIYVEDRDNTVFSKEIAKLVSDNATVITGISDMEGALNDGKIEYALVIENGATDSILKGESGSAGITDYYPDSSLRSTGLQEYLDSIIENAAAIAPSVGGDVNKLTVQLSESIQQSTVRTNKIDNIDRYRSYLTLGMMVMFILMGSVVYTALMVADKEKRTLYRSLIAPISMKNYLLQSILAFMCIAVIQVTILMIFLKFVVGLYVGDSFMTMYLLFILLALISVSFGVALASFSKNSIQGIFTGIGLVLPMSFLGGCWWENKMTGETLSAIGKLMPNYWLMEGINKALHNKTAGSMVAEIIIILIFTAVLFMLGSWRKQEIKA